MIMREIIQERNKSLASTSSSYSSTDEDREREVSPDDDEEEVEDFCSSASNTISRRGSGNHNAAARITGYENLALEDLDIIKTIGTGSFSKVMLVQIEDSGEFNALKILALHDVIKLKQVDHVKNEKSILKKVKHPFIVNLKWSFVDEFNIYMMFEFVEGGELFSYLRRAGHFSSSTTKFYAGELISALEYLHLKSIVFRDLKPENLLLDREGHLKIADFGFAKQLEDKTFTICGTVDYLAPEIIMAKGHDKAVDYWSLGVLIFEMRFGTIPFQSEYNLSTYEKILAGKIDWPKQFPDLLAKDIIRKLLTVDREKRLGNLKNGINDIKTHKWFKEFDWDEIFARKLSPPIIPKIKFEGDTSNFLEYPDEDTWLMKSISQEEQELFADF